MYVRRAIVGVFAAMATVVATVSVASAAGTPAAPQLSAAPAHAGMAVTPAWAGAQLINLNSRRCLVVPGNQDSTEGAGLIQWDCNAGYGDQFWYFTDCFNGGDPTLWCHLKNSFTQMCLAVPGGSAQNGIQLIQWPCGAFPDHYWRTLDPSPGKPGGTFRILNYNDKQCVGVAGGNPSNGVPIIQFPCNSNDSQHWYF